MIVMDTNIIVAALYSKLGASHALLVRALEGRLDFAVSVALALEYEAVLKRRATLERAWANDQDIETILNGLFSQAKLVTPIHFNHRPLLHDPNDEIVLECALEASAEAIVTVNVRDFLPVTSWPNIEVLLPGQLLARLLSKETQI
jgi:putative PIN family toxin of toxin-antitoxin system